MASESTEEKARANSLDPKQAEQSNEPAGESLSAPVMELEKHKSKLDSSQLADFGFTDIASHKGAVETEIVENVGGGGKKVAKRKSRNQTIVYGAGSDDSFDDDDQYAADAEDEKKEVQEGEDEKPAVPYSFGETYGEFDEDLWEDEEEEEEESEDSEAREEAEDEALYEQELERERLREIRLQEIMKKKEELIVRYLKSARVMIYHRKKNIYLQDYLYHLAARKGVLRGDPPATRGASGDESSSMKIAKAMEKRQRKKNAVMTSRFARFLRKTGKFYDADEHDHIHHHRRHHDTRRQRSRNLGRSGHPDERLRKHISDHYNFHRSRHSSRHRHLRNQASNYQERVKALPSTTVTKKDPTQYVCQTGEDCHDVHTKVHEIRHQHRQEKREKRAAAAKEKALASLDINLRRRTNKRPMTIMEILEAKAQATIKKLVKGPTDVLDHYEKHRCKLAKKKKLIKITKLLERSFAGTALIAPERHHLVAFVEHAVTQQNLARKRAMRKKKHQQEKESKTMGVKHLNHQWTKALDRIRELRIKKAKLEQEQRLELIKKVKHWHLWESKDQIAFEGVYEFVRMVSLRASMTKRETEQFQVSLEQFRKQLTTLYQAMLYHLVRLFKARSMLHMAQRKVKDSASVASPMKGFTIADYERMIIENEESHQKLKEKQENLRAQHDKLILYVKKVAGNHLKKQRTWGTLRAGRHDMKQLYELCRHERYNLLKKGREIRRAQERHQRFFAQVSVMSNKNCMKDYYRVLDRVQELNDMQTKLNTQVQQTETLLRVLKVKVDDARGRIEEDEKHKKGKALNEDLAFYKNTMAQRLNPKIPNTVYDANMMSRKSMEFIYSQQGGAGGKLLCCGDRRTSTPTPTTTARSDKNNKKGTKLPPVKA